MMESSELLKEALITVFELDSFCLVLILMLYENMRRSFKRNGRKIPLSLYIIYLGCALMVVFDGTWAIFSKVFIPGTVWAYIVNLFYFLSSSAAAAYWFVFATDQLISGNSIKKKLLHIVAMFPYIFVTVLYLLSPWHGYIFTIQDGEYIRGTLFYFDPLIKMGYILLASMEAVICGKHEKLGYLRKKCFNYVLFGFPVVICGILQVVTGGDFNCIGVTFGLLFIYVTGITNSDSENTEVIYSLGSSFDAAYIVNMDTGHMRPLREDRMHSAKMSGFESMDFEIHFISVLSQILLPEDRDYVLSMFRLEKVTERFKIDKSYSIRYRVSEKNNRTAIHTATFIRASQGGKQEFLLGINAIRTDSLLYERNEKLKEENQQLEKINMEIIESVAKIIESRDSVSGEHVIRVRKLTEILGTELMKEFPDLGLDEKRINMIASASVLHDVGKIEIPDKILLKPGKLTPEEFEIMKTHSLKGCDELNKFPLGLDDAFLQCALNICRSHHEKYDGSGYPDGLKGNQIPFEAQIVSVTDCFDALVSDRPYKKAFDPETAFEMIINGECGAISPRILYVMKKYKDRLLELAK